MIIAIDGPCGSGKGTISTLLAKKYNLINIDTGAIYRCLALASLRNNLDSSNTKEIIELSRKIKIELAKDGKVFLDKEDVTELIRSKEVTNIVSQISIPPEVRARMVEIQRDLASKGNAIIEGRDITTVVFPDADYKFYLDASLEERVKRRLIQNEEKKIATTYEEVLGNIEMRDYNDMHKPVGALKRTENQIYIDSTNMTIEEVVNEMTAIIDSKK